MNLYKIRGSLKYQYEGINIFIIDNIIRFFTPDLTPIPYQANLWVNDDIMISHVSAPDKKHLRIFFREYPQLITFTEMPEFRDTKGRYYYVKKGVYTYRIPFTINEMVTPLTLEKLRIFDGILVDDLRYTIFRLFLEICKGDISEYSEVRT